MALTRKQKEALAWSVISRVADLAEFWDEACGVDAELADVDRIEGIEQLSRWVSHLLGDAWDERLDV